MMCRREVQLHFGKINQRLLVAEVGALTRVKNFFGLRENNFPNEFNKVRFLLQVKNFLRGVRINFLRLVGGGREQIQNFNLRVAQNLLVIVNADKKISASLQPDENVREFCDAAEIFFRGLADNVFGFREVLRQNFFVASVSSAAIGYCSMNRLLFST